MRVLRVIKSLTSDTLVPLGLLLDDEVLLLDDEVGGSEGANDHSNSIQPRKK